MTYEKPQQSYTKQVLYKPQQDPSNLYPKPHQPNSQDVINHNSNNQLSADTEIVYKRLLELGYF